MPSYYVPLLLLLFIILRRHKQTTANAIMQINNKEEKAKMVELAKKFIGKECLISSFSGDYQYEGVIKEVSDGAVLIEKNGNTEAINLSFVIRIREYPRNKNGKKKAVIVD